MRRLLWEKLISDLQNGGKLISREADRMNCLFSQLQSMWKTFTSTLPSFKLKEADFEYIQIQPNKHASRTDSLNKECNGQGKY